MRRRIEQDLVVWKQNPRRLPLLLRGARQVGKSYVLERFGREHFTHLALANFEYQPQLDDCFCDLNPEMITARLEAMLKVPILPGETLLVLDEIQACPKAIMALRYFKEKMPDLHVIGAGSLLEFVLEEEQFSFPVGRVQFMHLGPLSFVEFLEALGEERLLSVEGEAIHQRSLELVRHYMVLGGMPAVVDEYQQSGSFRQARQVQQSILDTYRSDFGKYARKTQHKYLQRLFQRAPQLVGSHFRYSKVDPEMRSRELSVGLDQLCHAGLVRRIYATSANGLPLHAEINSRKFKILFLDIGLLQAANQTDMADLLSNRINSGQLAEQLVGQELIAYSSPYEERHLYFWEREKLGSSAEVDYVVRIDSKVVPIEVKAGATGRLRSLKQFMELKQVTIGVRICELPWHQEENILSVPFYAISRLIQQ